MRFPEEVPVLTDGVVTLRAHTEADVPRIVEQCHDPASVEWTSVPVPYDEADARRFVGSTIPRGWVDETAYLFAVEVGGRFAGTLDLRMQGAGEAELGFGLHPDARGDGVMRRALALLLDWGFAEHDLEVVHWRAFEGNWASRRTVWALGFRVGPTVPRLLPQRGRRRDAWTAWLGRDDKREPEGTWFDPPVLEADGVRLRPWADRDGPGLVEAAQDPAYQRWVPQGPLPRTAEEVPDYLLRVRLGHATGGRIAWCVADPESDAVLGSVAMFAFEDAGDDKTAELGYWSHPAGRGRGAMTTAVRAAIVWATGAEAQGGLGVRRLYLLTDVANTASRTLAERAGFRHAGTERAFSRSADGGWSDAALYDLLRDDSAV